MPDRLPPPWYVVPHEESFAVVDSNGFTIAYVYFLARPVVGTNPDRLTRDQARRVASNIAKIPLYITERRELGTATTTHRASRASS